MKLIIAGTRTFKDYELLKKEVTRFIGRHKDVEIISGLAEGADRLGLKYGVEHGFLVLQYPADWNRYGRAAGFMRNNEMAKIATHLIAFWDGKSKGTRMMINIAIKKNIETKVINYKNNNSCT